jgi:hypothetical protein
MARLGRLVTEKAIHLLPFCEVAAQPRHAEDAGSAASTVKRRAEPED